MARPVILCVDDERIILSSLKAQLQNNLAASFRIEVAESAEEALEITHELINKNTEIPIVIADQIMPGIKGDELLSQIKQLLPQTLTIMLTGQASADAVGKAVNKAGLFRYLSKPWDEDDLILTIQSALDSYQHQKSLSKQSYYQTVINQTLSLAIGTLNIRQQIAKSLNYLLSVPCLIPPSQGAIYLSSKSHVFNERLTENTNSLKFKKICSQSENSLDEELNIQPNEIDTYRSGFFSEKENDRLAYFCYPILFEDDLFEHNIAGLLFIYVDASFCHSSEISSFLSSFSQTLASIYRLSHSNYAFKQSNEKLKQHKLELEDLVKQRTEALNIALKKQEENNAKLLAANQELAFFATTDFLTGLLNRRHFFKLAENYYQKLCKQSFSCSVAMIDIDFFKAINDNYGHQVGDELLKKIASAIQTTLDERVLISRFGGEEFALLFPDTALSDAQEYCEQLLSNVSNTSVKTSCAEVPAISVTISIGLTQIEAHDNTIEQALSRADKALYMAKHNGRNTVCFLDSQPSNDINTDGETECK